LCLGATLLLDKALKKYDLSEKDMEYSLNEYGKPYFSNHSEIYFNLSHSGDYVLVVLSSDEVGCDIQQITNVNLKIADRFFTAKEREYIKNINGFFRVWALKESFIKLIGKGLSQPLNSFSIEDLDDEPYVIYNGEKYAFIEDKINDYVISICKEVK
jgi:4'-phosphopantetheinyl transferase